MLEQIDANIYKVHQRFQEFLVKAGLLCLEDQRDTNECFICPSWHAARLQCIQLAMLYDTTSHVLMGTFGNSRKSASEKQNHENVFIMMYG